MMQRRSFLQSASALSLLGLAGCATPVAHAVEGQGAGGRRRLRRRDRGQVRAAAVGPQDRRRAGRAERCVRLVPGQQPRARRQPHAGRHHDAVRRARAPARRDDRASDMVASIDAGEEGRRAGFAAPTIAYDKLVLSPGVELMWDGVAGPEGRQRLGPHPAGLEGRAGDGGAAPAARGDARRRRLRDHDARGAVPLPARARTSAPARWRATSRPPSRSRKVLILDANPDVTSKGALFKKVWAEQYPGMVEFRGAAQGDRGRRGDEHASSSRCRTT